MKRMLFNATHPEELRLALVDGQKLLDLDIESAAYQQKKGNIYKGRVTRIEPSLEAAFVDYGTERQGFLPLKEISRIYFQGVDENTPMAQVRIQDVIKEGQELIVQVDKEERGSKGAALTTFISLAGRFLVLMPNNPKGGGISRRIEGEERAELRQAMAQLELPEDYALIARTAGIGKSVEELQWDLDYLIHLWDAISKAAAEREAPFLIYQESNLVVRAIRDYLRADIGEILVDSADIYERMKKFLEQVSPHNLSKLKFYQEETPLFSRYQIEYQIDSAFSREVQLESGGALVFDRTEALLSIDVNSARATKGADIEETALQTNLEAAEEIARQLRLRDLGGLIVIDFIDMTPVRHQREVESRLIEALKNDRARVQVGRISRFGLLEMSRQRLRPSLGEASSIICPRCNGTGHIRGIQSSALNILRMIQEEVMKENSAAVHVRLPVETATFLLNEKRREINVLESRIGIPILVIPDPELETPHFRLRRVRSEEMEKEPLLPSYKIQVEGEDAVESATTPKRPAPERPAVAQLTHLGAAPPRKPQAAGGLFARLLKLFGIGREKPKAKPKKRAAAPRRKSGRPQQARKRPQGQRGRAAQRTGGGRSQKESQAKPQESANSQGRKRNSDGNSGRPRGGSRRGGGGRRGERGQGRQNNERNAERNGKGNGGRRAAADRPDTAGRKPPAGPESRSDKNPAGQTAGGQPERPAPGGDTGNAGPPPEAMNSPAPAPGPEAPAAGNRERAAGNVPSGPAPEQREAPEREKTPAVAGSGKADEGLVQVETRSDND